MSGYLPIGGGGAGGSSTVSTVSAIAEDMFFTSNNGRDTWAAGNPSRLYSGVACAVGSGNTYDYFMWDVQAGEWRDANLIYQGKKGDKGDKGDSGSVEAVTGVSMDIALGTISTTLTKQSGETISSIPVVLPEADGVASVSNAYSNNQLTTKITTESGAEFESSPVTIESGGGGGESLKSASHDVFNGALQTTYTLTDDSTIKSNAIELPSGGTVSIDAPDNTMIKVVDGVLVAAGVTESEGTIEVAPQSVKIGAHKLSSVGDALGSMNEATEQQRILVFQDISGGITQRPYVYKMKDDDWLNVASIPNTDGEVAKASQSISGFGVGGYYIIKPSTIFFETASSIIDFTFTIFDFDKKIFERTYSTSDATEKLLEHGAIVIDGAADISFAVADLDGNPIAVRGQTELDVQRFAFTIREAERAYLAYEGEGGSGGDYPKNPTFETVTLDMFAGSEASKNINFLSDDLTITNENDDHGVKIEGSHVTLSAGESDVVLDADALDLGFKELINIQSGNKSTSAVNLAQVESMLKNLFLQRVEVTLNDNSLSIDSQYAGKNVFVHGAGLNSELTLNADDFEDYQVVQITRSADYDNPAVPVIITEPNREIRFLVQGTTTFGIYDSKWLVLSDATVTLAEIDQRAGFKQYTQIKAGQGMTSAIDMFGVMTLDVVGGGGGNPSFEIPDNIVPIIVDKEPVASAISVEFDQLISPYGQQIAGHILESRGEVLAVNSHASVTQPIDTIGRYSNPKIFKEVDLEQSLTFINTNMHDEGIAHPNGQEILVHSEDYIWIRTEPDTIHFRAGKIGAGFEFIVVDQHENLIYKIRSSDSYNSNSVVHIHCPSLTLRANKSYHFIVNDLEGNPLTLLGASGVQAWVFDYRHLEQHELLTNQDSVLPEVAQFDQVKTLQLTDHTESVGLTLNSNGVVEVDGQLSLENHHIINISDAEHDHGATSLKQVRNLINNAEFNGSIDIDGQPVEAIQLNEDDFIYSYNEYSKVLNLNIKSNGGGGGGNADGTVNPIISENLMEGYFVEFATADGKFIRSANIRWEDIRFELERIWDKLDPAYKTAITAQTEAAANTLSIGHVQKDLKKLERKVTHNNLVNDDQALRLAELDVEDKRQDKHLNTLDIEHQQTRTSVNNHQVEIESLTSDYATLLGVQEETTADLTALDTQVTTIASFPLERMAAGEFESSLSIADSFDTLTDSAHYVTPYGSEIEYHLPPDARTVEPNYTVKLKVDGVQHEALKLTTTAIRAGMKPIKELVDGVDAQDAVTVNQLAPINDKIDSILDRLDAIEAHIGMILPPPSVFTVYSGRLFTTNGTTEDPNVIKALHHNEGNTEFTLLENVGNNGYTIEAEPSNDPFTFSWSVIAYPKGVLSPDPKKVVYNSLPPADRNSYEIVIDQVVYIVLIGQMPDSFDTPTTYTLLQ